MNQNAINLLEYGTIKTSLKEYAVSDLGKELIEKMQISGDIDTVELWLKETTETRAIVDKSSSVPLGSLVGVEKVMVKFGKGSILSPEDLTVIQKLLEAGAKIKRFMAGKEILAPLVSSYACSIYELKDIVEEIDRCIVNDRIDDRASSDLSKVRKKISIVEDRITSKLESILRSPAYRDYIQDSLISMRNGRYVIPVKREYRRNIGGNVLDTSTSGSTVFIEPIGVKKLQEELNLLKLEEEKEEYRILSYLTAMVESYDKEITINIQTITHYDFLFAKAKYSRAIEGKRVKLNTGNYINIIDGKHPIIGRSAVPLNLEIGRSYRTLVITGPNTGGKTVALKTVGLLTMMVQSGLHVPVADGSEFALFRDILVDIGDGQSIEQSLSTFSSHVRNISGILECADNHTLVIVDELGTGTDPAEGMGLAIAVLEEIHKKGSVTIATTHYSEIKDYADNHEGFENGCMEFDIDTLKPLYRLKIGKSGESNAFLIALRLGMNRRVIERAHEITYKERKEYAEPVVIPDSQKMINTEVVESHFKAREKLEKTAETRAKFDRQKIDHSFKVGDCVYVSSMGRTGIVYEPENSKGEVGVMIMKKKFVINKKRLSLYIDSKEMYPDEYDYDIVFESKENRKARHQMSRKHIDGLVIDIAKNN